MAVMIRPLILVALMMASAAPFAPPSSASSSLRWQTATLCSASTSRLNGNTKVPAELPPLKDISYGEQSRQYRRTVYSHDDWRKHRSPDRFFYYMRSVVNSGVYKNLAREVSTTTAIATIVVVYNALVGGYTDLMGVQHAALVESMWTPLLTLPLAPFTLSSPSLGLLLGMFLCFACYGCDVVMF
jgi:ion channel-forming bestrophin family protein